MSCLWKTSLTHIAVDSLQKLEWSEKSSLSPPYLDYANLTIYTPTFSVGNDTFKILLGCHLVNICANKLGSQNGLWEYIRLWLSQFKRIVSHFRIIWINIYSPDLYAMVVKLIHGKGEYILCICAYACICMYIYIYIYIYIYSDWELASHIPNGLIYCLLFFTAAGKAINHRQSFLSFWNRRLLMRNILLKFLWLKYHSTWFQWIRRIQI